MEDLEQDSGLEGQPAPVDPRRMLLLPLWRGRHVLLACALLGALGGVLSGIVRPNSYKSIGKLMIRAGAREQVTPESSVMGTAGGFGMGGRNVVLDELLLLDAPEVYEAAARAVTPVEILRPYDPGARDGADSSGLLALFHRGQSWWFQRSADDDDLSGHAIDACPRCVHVAALTIARNLSIVPEPGTDVITVSYTAHDGELARKVVSAFLEASIAHHRKIYETNTTVEFVAKQMQDSLRDLTAVENEFTNFKTECGVFEFDAQQHELISAIHSLEALVEQDKSSIEELRARTKELKELISTLPETIEERIEHNLQANPERGILKQRIATLEDSLAAVERREGGSKSESERDRAYYTQEIGRAKAKLEQEPEFVDAGPSVRKGPNARREQKQQQLDDANSELKALEGAASVRSGSLAEMRTRQLSMSQCEPKFHALQETTLHSRGLYEGFRQAHEKASLMSSMDQLEISNLRVIQGATLPDEKEGPIRGKLILIGVLLGLVGGCGLAFLRNLLDHRLHDAVDVEQLVGLPVLAEFSALSGSPRRWQFLRRSGR